MSRHLWNGRPEPLALREFGGSGVVFASGMAAADWVFATGLGPYAALEPPCGVQWPIPTDTPELKQARATLDLLSETLAAAHADLRSVVRLDQYYLRPGAVTAYQRERKRRLDGYVPASTSVLVKRLLPNKSLLEIEAIGVRGERAKSIEILNHPGLSGPSSAAYAAAVRSGEFVFVSGCMASASGDQPARRGVALAALTPEGSQWKGLSIDLQTRYVIEHKLAPALALAGASLNGLVKVQAYLTDAEDLPAFLQVWAEYVGASGPALNVVTPGHSALAIEDCRIEINAIAVSDDHLELRESVDAGLPRVLAMAPNAVRVGELLFFSSLLPLDDAGQMVGCEKEPVYSAISSRVAAQARALLRRAASLCTAAGTDLGHCLRLQFFLNSIDDAAAIHGAMSEFFGSHPLSFSFVQAGVSDWANGAALQADFWVYCPQPR